MTLSLHGWKDVAVRPTTHKIEISRPKSETAEEPVSPRLFASLVHPDRRSNIIMLRFSPDGRKLFTAGSPSCVVQLWDVASRTELLQIATPRQHIVHHFAQLSSDWRTLYAPMIRRSSNHVDGAGETGQRFDHRGKIGVWHLDSGRQRAPIVLEPKTVPVSLWLSPDDQFLVYAAESSERRGDVLSSGATHVLRLRDGSRRKLSDGKVTPVFLGDSRRVAVSVTGVRGGGDRYASSIQILDLATGKQVASLACPDELRYFSFSTYFPGGMISPDRSTLAVMLGGKPWSPVEVWFVDSATLRVKGKLTSEPRDKYGGWGYGTFSPDGTRFVLLGSNGRLLVWNLVQQRLERAIETGVRVGSFHWSLAVSPDSTFVAFACMESEGDRSFRRNPDPRDFPQPRVHLFRLDDGSKIEALVAPHGWVGGLRFSPDGKQLAFGSAGAVHLFDLARPPLAP